VRCQKVSCAAETLHKSGFSQCATEGFAGILAASIAMEDCSVQLLSVLHFKFLYGTDVQFLFHVVVHSNGKDLAVEAIKYCGNIAVKESHV